MTAPTPISPNATGTSMSAAMPVLARSPSEVPDVLATVVVVDGAGVTGIERTGGAVVVVVCAHAVPAAAANAAAATKDAQVKRARRTGGDLTSADAAVGESRRPSSLLGAKSHV